jgi:hypothetical protein
MGTRTYADGPPNHPEFQKAVYAKFANLEPELWADVTSKRKLLDAVEKLHVVGALRSRNRCRVRGAVCGV